MKFELIFLIGFLAQILFSARLVVQWIQSEREKRVVAPTLFWQLSLIASFILLVYGILRDDPVIILGQLLSYFIYIRNLQYKNAWNHIPRHFKLTVIIFPILILLWLLSDFDHNWKTVLNNNDISAMMVTWGSIGQVIFTFRFVYQWYYSEKIKKSILPKGFWIISIIGSVIITSYGIYRLDPVIVLGQAFGLFIYARNLFLIVRSETTILTSKV